VAYTFTSCSFTDVARNFDRGLKIKKICDVILVPFFGDVMAIASLK